MDGVQVVVKYTMLQTQGQRQPYSQKIILKKINLHQFEPTSVLKQ